MPENAIDPGRKMQEPLISVVVTGYNHEKYIAQCIDSVLMQKGCFRLEVILADDCSSDSTGRIMQAYHKKHPDIFILMPEEPNMGITKNIKRCFDACTGDYIAFCESDDYWTDIYKLQKQLEFMQSHPDYAMCFNAIILYYEDEKVYATVPEQLFLKTDTIRTEDLLDKNYIGNVTCCLYRTDVIRRLPPQIYEIPLYDWVFNMTCGGLGKIGFIRDWMSVYRKHGQGAWSGKTEPEKWGELLALYDIYNQFFSYKYDKQFRRKKAELENAIASAERQASQVSGDNRQPAAAIFKYAAGNPVGAFKIVLVNAVMELNRQQGSSLHGSSALARYGELSMRAIKNPRAAFKVVRTIINSVALEANSILKNRQARSNAKGK